MFDKNLIKFVFFKNQCLLHASFSVELAAIISYWWCGALPLINCFNEFAKRHVNSFTNSTTIFVFSFARRLLQNSCETPIPDWFFTHYLTQTSISKRTQFSQSFVESCIRVLITRLSSHAPTVNNDFRVTCVQTNQTHSNCFFLVVN